MSRRGFLRHKNMTDVAFEIFGFQESPETFDIVGLWYNLNGLYHDPRPFPMGVGSKPAMEEIKIKRDDFKDWTHAYSLESLKTR